MNIEMLNFGRTFLLVILSLFFSCEIYAVEKTELTKYTKGYPINQIRDLVLIYQGGANRIDWTESQFIPYVTHKFADGKIKWLFDGFLFLDFNDGMGHTYIPAYGFANARKVEWEWYLNRLFEKGKSLDALNKCISRLKNEIGEPGFRHKVVLSIPTPLVDQKDWGVVYGKKLDFTSYNDRALAAKWYINEIVSRFKAQGYENLELTGLYWIDEDICHTKELIKYIAPLVHEKNLEFVWIPYFRARGYDRWKELGFDIAYHQPNHFFSNDIPDSRLDEACDIALDLGMALEFECDSKALYGAPNSSYYRMQSYIDAFRRNRVFDTSAIAYYTGSKAFIDMAENPCRENQRIMDELSEIIVERRNNKNLDVTGGVNEIFNDSDTRCFPNPVNLGEVFNVKIKGETLVNIFDVSGHLLFSGKYDYDTLISTENLRKGIYLVQLKNDVESTVIKIIIK